MLDAFLKAGINTFEISKKFCVFWIPILLFKKKNFGVIIALFAILKCKCEKNFTFSNILQKVKTYFLPISIILSVIPIKFETLKAPTVYSASDEILSSIACNVCDEIVSAYAQPAMKSVPRCSACIWNGWSCKNCQNLNAGWACTKICLA